MPGMAGKDRITARKKIVIFGGTEEGRKLSTELAGEGADVTVCVASPYGRETQGTQKGIRVVTGPLSPEEKTSLLRGTDLCIDATHPYAVHITKTVREACRAAGIRYIRLLRASSVTEHVTEVKDAAEAADYLAGKEGNILLTTGLKELPQFCRLDKGRLFPRILPTSENLRICEELQIPARNILAMQGPFSKEMNIAAIRQYHISYLVSKDGGAAGGYPEKAEAAAETGIELILIRRPQEEDGLSFEEVRNVCRELSRENAGEISCDPVRKYSRETRRGFVGNGFREPERQGAPEHSAEVQEELFRKELTSRIRPTDSKAMFRAERRWNSIAKPLHSLGKLEELVIRLAGIQRTDRVDIWKKALVVMCADNGVVEEGVTQTGQEVTAIVAGNFLTGRTNACRMAASAGVDVFPVDVGMVTEVSGMDTRKTARGTGNIAQEPAMSRVQALAAIRAGIRKAEELKQAGYSILASGEMGIGNTTTSSAVVSVLLNLPPDSIIGRGAGLSDDGLKKKRQAVQDAIAVNRPDPADPVDVLAKVGGFDIAALTGLYLGAAAEGLPVVADGLISLTAALLAVRMVPACRDYILASHVSKEPAVQYLLDALQLSPILHADMHLGEGTGAVALFPLLDMAMAVYTEMSTFADIHVEAYREMDITETAR